MLQLTLADDGLSRDLILDDRNAGNVGERLCKRDVGVGERYRLGHEQVEATKNGIREAERNGTHGRKAATDALLREQRPPGRGVQVCFKNESSCMEAIETRSFVVLDLKELKQLHPFVGCTDHTELSGAVGEEDARSSGLE